MKFGTRLLLSALLWLPLAAAQAQFKWTDAQGKVHYGDNPPRDARNIQRVGGAAPDPSDPNAGLPYELRRATQNFPVTLYTTGNCPPCEAGRSLLQARGVPYTERTINSTDDIEELKRQGLGGRLPVLKAGNQNVKEYETQAWHTLLDTAGYPRTSRLPRTWAAPSPQPLTPAPNAQGVEAAAPTPAPKNGR
jgi:glutaredoxin